MQFALGEDVKLWITPLPGTDYCQVAESKEKGSTPWPFQLARDQGKALRVKIVCGPANPHKADIGRYKLANRGSSVSVSVIGADVLV
jgi:hypothetical protein